MSDFTITVIDSENVIESTTTTVEIISVGMQGPSGPKGDPGDFDASIIVDMQNQVDNLESEVGLVRTLAQANDLKIGTKADQADLDVTEQQVEQNRLAILTKADISALAQLALLVDTKADQVDLETAEQQVELNRLAILTKADIAALAMLAQLVDTKADQAYVNQQIANLVGSAPEALNTVYELAAAIQDNAGVINTLNQSVANRVRFDVATQALTEIQEQNARTNIGAETLGTAATLVAAITAASIGAATAAQGNKADTALQSADVAPVALSGLFNSLVGQNKIFDVVFGAYALGSNTAVVATDTLGQIIGKLQAQINNPPQPTWVNAASIGTIHPAFSTVQFAKINGLLWIRGYCNNITIISAGSTLFSLTDPSYHLNIPSTSATPFVLGEIKTITNDGDTKLIRLKNVVNNANKFSLHNFDRFAANDYNQIQPVALGVLLTP